MVLKSCLFLIFSGILLPPAFAAVQQKDYSALLSSARCYSISEAGNQNKNKAYKCDDRGLNKTRNKAKEGINTNSLGISKANPSANKMNKLSFEAKNHDQIL
ncbi:MAG: hypothetical protein AABY64_10035 [Bdellovibrionota bacterium]